jgi:hypothetical protein
MRFRFKHYYFTTVILFYVLFSSTDEVVCVACDYSFHFGAFSGAISCGRKNGTVGFVTAHHKLEWQNTDI